MLMDDLPEGYRTVKFITVNVLVLFDGDLRMMFIQGLLSVHLYEIHLHKLLNTRSSCMIDF